jgi:hypothetical protein
LERLIPTYNLERIRPSWIGVLALAALAAAIAAVIWFRPWDPRMGASRSARALETRLQTTVRYRCSRTDGDGSTAGVGDIDYYCEPIARPDLEGYFVGTNFSRITNVIPTG